MSNVINQVPLTTKQVKTFKDIEAQEIEISKALEQLKALKQNLLVFAIESAGLSTDSGSISVNLVGTNLEVQYNEGGQIPNPSLVIDKE